MTVKVEGNTKWNVLQARLAKLEADAKAIRDELSGMERTTLDNCYCSRCGKVLATEAEFAQHFLISDPRYLNLGDCPEGKTA